MKSKCTQLCLAILVALVALMSLTSAVEAGIPPQYNLGGVWTFDDIHQGVHHYHTMTISAYDPSTGAFSGSGFYIADPTIEWIISGTEIGDQIAFTLTVISDNSKGVTLTSTTGTITSQNYMSGTGTQTNVTPPEVNWTATKISGSVVPEYPLGALAALGACFVGFVLFKKHDILSIRTFRS